MRSKLTVALLLSALSSGSVFAATNVNIQIIDAGTNIVGDVYIGPYQALVNGIPTPVICDDFQAETPLNSLWTATTLSVADLTTSANLSATRWGAAGATAETYKQAAWLAVQLDGWTAATPCATGNCQADLQFAIWSLFDPTAATYYAANASVLNNLAVLGWQQQAAANADSSGIDFSNVLIYTPSVIQGGPQEFLSVVRTPEPGAGVLLSIQALGLFGFVYFIRRRSAGQKR